MPVLGRRVTSVNLISGDTLTVLSEPAPDSLPLFTGKTPDKSLYITQREIYPLGTRLTYSLLSPSQVPTPVLCQYRNSERGAAPVPVFPLHNIIDPSLLFDPVTRRIHLLWWWNGWTPTDTLPQPPRDFYKSHSVPDPLTPPWLKSLVPKSSPAPFNPRAPFWVAPIPDGYQYDAYPGVIMGESRVNGPNRIPDTPGARYLQDLVTRGLLENPGPPEAPFGAVPSSERDNWERRGGIIGAGEHIKIASLRDNPEFVPVVSQNPYTHESEMAELPGVGVAFPSTTTWQDHLTIINALTAHYDHANLGNSTRVLMWASGFLHESMILDTLQKKFPLNSNQSQGTLGPAWPPQVETVTADLLLLDFPRVIAAFPTGTNYRTTINPDQVHYPYLDYPDIGVVFHTDGYLGDCATPHVKQNSAVDWVISDPTDCASQVFDMFRNHLDNRSY